jgi:hypothetical protein
MRPRGLCCKDLAGEARLFELAEKWSSFEGGECHQVGLARKRGLAGTEAVRLGLRPTCREHAVMMETRRRCGHRSTPHVCIGEL